MKSFPFTFLFVILLQGAVWAQEELPKVVAQEGDGIYSLLRRHGVSPTKHTTILWK